MSSSVFGMRSAVLGTSIGNPKPPIKWHNGEGADKIWGGGGT